MDHVGETCLIIDRPLGFNKKPLTPDDITKETIKIIDASGTPVVDTVDMAWDEEGDADGPWFGYKWQTADAPAGTYRALCTVIGPGDDISFEWKRIRLKKPV